jgi:hypothetical protein
MLRFYGIYHIFYIGVKRNYDIVFIDCRWNRFLVLYEEKKSRERSEKEAARKKKKRISKRSENKATEGLQLHRIQRVF